MNHHCKLFALACVFGLLFSPAVWAQTTSPPPDQNAEIQKLIAAGKFAEAQPLAERLLAEREQALGPEHASIASTLLQLATIQSGRGDTAKAEASLQRALAIATKQAPPGHPDLGLMHLDLGRIYFNRNDFIQAEAQFQGALTAWQQRWGPNHPDVGRAYSALGTLYVNKGDMEKAEQPLQRALEIIEQTQGKEHPALSRPLLALGGVYRDRKQDDKAEPVFQRLLNILEKQPATPPVTQSLAGVLNNLGAIAQDRRQFTQAETFYRRALALREKQFGAEHPDVAQSLNNLAALAGYEGAYAKSAALYQQTLTMREKLLGTEHPAVVSSLRGLNRALVAQDNLLPALANWARIANISEGLLAYNLTAGSEREKLAYLSTYDQETNQLISLHLRYAANNTEAARLALTAILRHKGRALDAMTDSIAALRRRASPADQALLDQLRTVRAQLARLVLNGPQGAKPAEHASRIKTLETQREELEAEISRRSAAFRAQAQPVTIEAVQALIPAQAALVEFVAYRPFNAKFTQPSEEFDAPRYAAYVLRQQGAAQWVELGDKQPIDEAVANLRRALRDRKRRDYKRLARAVDRLVLQPVRPLLGRTRRVLLAPDGGLNLLPFAALVDQRNEFLIRRYSFSYLTSGRDLLRLQAKPPGRQSALIIANPDFGAATEDGKDAGKATERILRYRPAQTAPANESGQSSVLAEAYFPPLPGTDDEARTLKTLLPDASVFIQQDATEAKLKQASGPQILHIATHGFFLADDSAANAGARLLVKQATTQPGGNPLLRSGLALAGANQPKRAAQQEDGILTALEAAALDLWGTRLVVLSACETGLGEVKDGDGVYGLRRALVLAGAETQVMSLWSVSDLATRNLMIGYYRRLQGGGGRAEALRQAQLRLLTQPPRPGARDYRHPYYWAGFIPSGEWASLDGQR